MQIRNVTAGYSDPTALGRRAEALEPAAGRGAVDATQTAPAAGAKTAMAEILAAYDVTDITPAEFSEMIQKLYEQGAISSEELQELAAVRLDLESAGFDPDRSVDLLDFYARRIAKLQRELEDANSPQAIQRELAALRGRLDWLEKFAVVQANPDAVGLDTVA